MKLKDELRRAILRSLLGKYSLYIIQLISIAVLARVFAPEIFGIVAAAQVIVMFFQMLATSGLAPALIYQKTVPQEMRDGVFSFSLFVGCLLGLFFIGIAEPLFNWFEFEQGLVVFYVLAPCVLFSSLSMVPMASLQKDAKFLMIARSEIFSEIISFAACIVASFYWASVSALALKFLLVPFFRFIFYYWFCVNTTIGRPGVGKKLSQVKKLYSFAKYQISFNILNFFASNLDNLLIAKYFGAASLGVYEKTYQIMRYPLQLFTFAITPALQPVLTKYKDRPELVFDEYFDVAYKLALVGLFSSTVLFWNADDVVFLMFGPQWLDVVPYLQILALSIPVQMVLSSTGGVYQAFGHTKAMFYCGAFSAAVTITAISIGIYFHDIEILCIALVCAYIINLLQCYIVLFITVFKNQQVMRFVLLCILIGFSFINLLFFNKEDAFTASYIDSLINIVITSSFTALPILFVFYIMYRFKRKV